MPILPNEENLTEHFSHQIRYFESLTSGYLVSFTDELTLMHNSLFFILTALSGTGDEILPTKHARRKFGCKRCANLGPMCPHNYAKLGMPRISVVQQVGDMNCIKSLNSTLPYLKSSLGEVRGDVNG
ncbi:uncharacterized protein LOC115768118 isoform X1 [Drosophila novamexicana]|uniref:uncharacterized protein LOC115768118 isoform X1 n=1 Tax=Drosophila novamexicana TaxID=47314 RepID=UPI0011E59FA2|nr:uncharacterized protein LOC115768118 isoform X1 [Drosophila novamexicana]